MNGIRIAVFICLVAGVVGQDAPDNDLQSESGLNGETTVYGLDEESTTENLTDTTDATFLETNSTEISTVGSEDVTNSTKDTGGDDIVITGTGSPDEEDVTPSETEEPPISTVYDDDITSPSESSGDEERNRTVCSSNPCRNGGTCNEDPRKPTLFSCVCPAGYVGIRCGTVDRCVEDEEAGELCNGGACVYSADGLLRFCKCFSGKYWNEAKAECQEPDSPCFPSPCLNGGTCRSEDDLAICDCPTGFQGNNCSVRMTCGDCEKGTCVLDDEQTTKYCRCNEGFYWNQEKQACEEMVSPCDSSPCHNGGACEAVPDAEYNCTCASGFSGTTCDVTDRCSRDEDCRNGTCLLSGDGKARTCHCDEGFYLEEEEHRCEEITHSICQPNPCLHDGICSDSPFECRCSEGYVGWTCDIRDPCKMDGGDAYCADAKCSHNRELGLYYCTCEPDEYFQYTERKCAGLDVCPLMQWKCNPTQICSMSKCQCGEKYKWNNVTEKCEPDFCSFSPCPASGMNCQEGTGSTDYKCTCQEGYAFNGTHCNEAMCFFPALNDCDQVCSPKEAEYECSCENEFELKANNQSCSYTGNYTCANRTCGEGFCVLKDSVEECLCPPGYVQVNETCKDVCSVNQLPSGICPLDKCESTSEGEFSCKCEGKFALSEDKATCIARNVCQENELGWKTCRDRNAECMEDWDSSEGYTCQCGLGHVKTEGGICRGVCSLDINQRQCSIKGATCDVDAKGKMLCRCPPYFKENERDGKCTQPADFSYLVTLPLDKSNYQKGNRKLRSLDISIDYTKIMRDVTLTIQPMFTDFTTANILSCKSSPRFSHILCRIEMQFATERQADLNRLRSNQAYLGEIDSKKCLLPPSLVLVFDRILTDVDIQPTDPCDEDIQEFICGSETTCTSSLVQKSFNCSCKPGFYARRRSYPFGNTRSFIEACADIDECLEGNPCPVNSDCLNTIGNYTCSCIRGFRSIEDAFGSNAQKCVEICNPNPCTHGQCSTRGDHEFDCSCEAGYRGTFCNLQDGFFKRARNNSIIVGVVLGGILLITFILFAVYISRLRKKKNYENPSPMFYNSAEMTERRRVEGGAINNAFQRE